MLRVKLDFLNLLVVLIIAVTAAPGRTLVWLAQLHAPAVQQATMPQLVGLTALKSAGLALQDCSLLLGPLHARSALLVPFPTSTPQLNAQAVLQENIRLNLELMTLKYACRVKVENILAHLPLPGLIV